MFAFVGSRLPFRHQPPRDAAESVQSRQRKGGVWVVCGRAGRGLGGVLRAISQLDIGMGWGSISPKLKRRAGRAQSRRCRRWRGDYVMRWGHVVGELHDGPDVNTCP